MPVYINKSSGEAESLGAPEGDAALTAGTHEIPLYNPKGEAVSAPKEQAGSLLQQGYSQPTPEENKAMLESAGRNTLGKTQQALAEGIAHGALGPVATLIDKLKPEAEQVEQKKTEEAHPIATGAGEVAGLAMPGGFGTALGKVGGAAAKIANYGTIGSAAVRGAAEMALYGTSNEATKFLQNDPDQTAQTAIANIGIGAILGATGGAALGTATKAFELVQPKASAFLKGFQNKLNGYVAPEAEAALESAATPKSPFTKDIFTAKQETGKLAAELGSNPKARSPFTKDLFNTPGLKIETAAPVTEALPEAVSKAEPIVATAAEEKATAAGEKAAEAFLNKKLGDVAAGAVGAAIGGAAGHPWLGAMLGKDYLGKHADAILTSIIKPLLGSEANGGALRAALDYGTAALKGETMLGNAVKNVFNAAAFEASAVSAKERDAIKAKVNEIQQDPGKLLDVGGSVGHYMPGHAQSLGQTSSNVVQHLASLKPNTDPTAPLDEHTKPSNTAEAVYNNAIDIAQNPMSVLKSVKSGSITVQEIHHLQAMYPALMKSMQAKIGQELINAKSTGQRIPYATQIGLSAFMGQPLTASLSQQSIAASQPLPAMPHTPAGIGSPAKAHGAAKSLTKLPSSYETPQQSRSLSRVSSRH